MRKNTASQAIGAQMVSASDGSAFTGAVTVYVTGDAGTQAVGSVGSGACTHEGNGYHTYAPAQAETNYNLIAFTFIGTGAVPATVQVFTTANLVDDVWDEVLSGATHNVATSAGRRLRTLQDNGLYALASAWVDEANGTSTGTTDYEDGTVTNRSDDLDNAQTVADSVGLSSIQVTNGNSITLSAALEGYNLWGNGASLALGGQNVGGSVIREFSAISGIGTSTGSPIFFENCLFGAVTLAPSILQQCGIGAGGGTLTVGSAGAFRLIDCYSDVAGTAAPVVDLGAAVGATTIEFRRWSGGLTLNNVATGDVVSVDAISGGTVTVNGTGGTVAIRGMVLVTDNSGGAVTITQQQVVNMTSINAEVDTAISDAALATAAALTTVDTVVDAIKAKTDSLTFTVAGNVDSNVQYVNDVQVGGTGAEGDEWGPA